MDKCFKMKSTGAQTWFSLFTVEIKVTLKSVNCITQHFKLDQAKKPFGIIKGHNFALAKDLDMIIYQSFSCIIPIYQTLWSLQSLSSFKLFLG